MPFWSAGGLLDDRVLFEEWEEERGRRGGSCMLFDEAFEDDTGTDKQLPIVHDMYGRGGSIGGGSWGGGRKGTC